MSTVTNEESNNPSSLAAGDELMAMARERRDHLHQEEPADFPIDSADVDPREQRRVNSKVYQLLGENPNMRQEYAMYLTTLPSFPHTRSLHLSLFFLFFLFFFFFII